MALVPFPNKARTPDPDDDWNEDESPDGGGKMSFLEHLDELRRRLVYSLLAVVVGFAIACVFLTPRWGFPGLFNFVMAPMQAALEPGQRLIWTEPTEALMLYLKIALIGGC